MGVRTALGGTTEAFSTSVRDLSKPEKIAETAVETACQFAVFVLWGAEPALDLLGAAAVAAVASALLFARKVEDGAMVIDINLDDGLLDGMAAMQKFCKIAVTEPDVSKVGHACDAFFTHQSETYTPYRPPAVWLSCHFARISRVCRVVDNCKLDPANRGYGSPSLTA